jgi:hypothetical protein
MRYFKKNIVNERKEKKRGFVGTLPVHQQHSNYVPDALNASIILCAVQGHIIHYHILYFK